MKRFRELWIALLAIVALSLVAASNECCENECGAGRDEAQVKVWKKVPTTRGTYVTQVPIQLPNGNAVYCILAEGIWCQNVDAPTTSASQAESCPLCGPSSRASEVAPSSNLGDLDFGGR